MFDLEKAVAAWRAVVARNDAVSNDDADELESHLRDEVDGLVRLGHGVEEAFHFAVRRTGSYATIDAAYRAVLPRKASPGRRLGRWADLAASHVRLALRSLALRRGYAFLNVFGLAVGMAACLLILTYVRHEWSYDRFHPAADRTFRITTSLTTERSVTREAGTFPVVVPTLVAEMPEVVQGVRLMWFSGPVVEAGGRRFYEDGFVYADSTVFDVFAFPLLRGDPETALVHPHTLVLTETAARRYFGGEDPMGRTLTVDDRSFEVTGVLAPLPSNTHLAFDFLASFETHEKEHPGYFADNWHVWGGSNYVVLRDPRDAETLAPKLAALTERHTGERFGAYGMRVGLHLQPVTNIHLHSHLDHELRDGGNATYVSLLAFLAAAILLVACLNFVNLATARAAERAVEVGVRKVVGAHRGQLVRQFLTESVVTALLALVVAAVLYRLGLPVLGYLSGQPLAPSGGDAATGVVIGFLGCALAAGLIAGSYPALLLSRFRPVAALRRMQARRTSDVFVRKGLVVLQFAVSIGLALGTVVLYRQLAFMKQAPLGFERTQVVTLREGFRPEEPGRVAAMKAAFRDLPGVRRVALASELPTRPHVNTIGLRPEGAAEGDVLTVTGYQVDEDYVDALGLEVVAGRSFSAAAADSYAVVLNETAVRRLGFEDAVGKQLFSPNDGAVWGTVVGVVRDFHHASLHEPVAPVVLSKGWYRQRRFVLKLDGRDVPGTMARIRQVWRQFVPEKPLAYTFLDQAYDALYRDDERRTRVVAVFSALALFVACLGLFGLAAFSAAQRTKEIGIRKVLGASATSLLVLLAKDFVRLVALAFAVAVPLAYLGAHRWLDGFAYRVPLSWEPFVLTGLGALLAALLTVSVQVLRAALTDPVRALRHE